MKVCIIFIFIFCVICIMCSKWLDVDLLKSLFVRNVVCFVYWLLNVILCVELYLYRCVDCCEWFGIGSFFKLGFWI